MPQPFGPRGAVYNKKRHIYLLSLEKQVGWNPILEKNQSWKKIEGKLGDDANKKGAKTKELQNSQSVFFSLAL